MNFSIISRASRMAFLLLCLSALSGCGRDVPSDAGDGERDGHAQDTAWRVATRR